MSGNFGIREWANCWIEAGKKLEQIKDRELQDVDVSAAISNLSSAFKAALRSNPAQPYSGLVEQQRIFKILSHE